MVIPGQEAAMWQMAAGFLIKEMMPETTMQVEKKKVVIWAGKEAAAETRNRLSVGQKRQPTSNLTPRSEGIPGI